MARVRIDRDQCIACETCWLECPEVFQSNPEDNLSEITPEFRIGGDSATGKVPDELRFSVQEAADACPVAINHVEDG